MSPRVRLWFAALSITLQLATVTLLAVLVVRQPRSVSRADLLALRQAKNEEAVRRAVLSMPLTAVWGAIEVEANAPLPVDLQNTPVPVTVEP